MVGWPSGRSEQRVGGVQMNYLFSTGGERMLFLLQMMGYRDRDGDHSDH